jgi:energy-coupling factor transport system substrate-specific component
VSAAPNRQREVVFAVIVLVNDFFAAVVLGPPLLYLLYPCAKAAGLLYPVLMDDQLPSVAPRRQQTAAVGITVVAVAWLFAGIGISVWVHGVPLVVPVGEVTLGSGGSTLQIAVGAVAFAVLAGASAMAGERLSSIYRPATRPA